jgi:hypothetical protein
VLVLNTPSYLVRHFMKTWVRGDEMFPLLHIHAEALIGKFYEGMVPLLNSVCCMLIRTCVAESSTAFTPTEIAISVILLTVTAIESEATTPFESLQKEFLACIQNYLKMAGVSNLRALNLDDCIAHFESITSCSNISPCPVTASLMESSKLAYQPIGRGAQHLDISPKAIGTLVAPVNGVFSRKRRFSGDHFITAYKR